MSSKRCEVTGMLWSNAPLKVDSAASTSQEIKKTQDCSRICSHNPPHHRPLSIILHTNKEWVTAGHCPFRTLWPHPPPPIGRRRLTTAHCGPFVMVPRERSTFGWPALLWLMPAWPQQWPVAKVLVDAQLQLVWVCLFKCPRQPQEVWTPWNREFRRGSSFFLSSCLLLLHLSPVLLSFILLPVSIIRLLVTAFPSCSTPGFLQLLVEN